MVSPYLIVASVGGVGFSPKAPGTVGSIIGLLFLICSIHFQIGLCTLWLIFGLLNLVGWFSSHQLLKQSLFKDNDPSYIVIDEVVGIWLTVLILLNFYPPSWKLYLLSFITFRFFDIVKPWPINWVDNSLAKYPPLAAFGIMIDDVLAALMAVISIAGLNLVLEFL